VSADRATGDARLRSRDETTRANGTSNAAAGSGTGSRFGLTTNEKLSRSAKLEGMVKLGST
jgi:hypothetical protein